MTIPVVTVSVAAMRAVYEDEIRKAETEIARAQRWIAAMQAALRMLDAPAAPQTNSQPERPPCP